MIHLRFQVPHSTHDLFLQGSSRPKMTRGEKRYQTKQFAQPVLANQTNVYEETDVILWKDDASPGVEPARCEWLVEEQRRDLLQAKFTEVMCDSPGTARDVNTGSACPLRTMACLSIIPQCILGGASAAQPPSVKAALGCQPHLPIWDMGRRLCQNSAWN